MIAPPMRSALLLAATLMLSGLSGSLTVVAQCAAPLTVMLTAQNQWKAWLFDANSYTGSLEMSGPVFGDSLIAPYSSVDRIMNITVYTTLSLVEIFVLVDSADASGNSLIASVSYNGVKYATTGDDVSRWAYTNDMNEINAFTDSLTYTGYNPDLWPFVDTTARCSAETAPSMNLDDVSYSELISANGITPQTDQYGGTTSHWIGVNGNDGECSAPSKVLYYLKLDLYSLAEEPTCFSQGDGRSFLGSTTPIMSFPSIGRKTATSSVLTFIGSAEGPYEVWGDGMGAVGLSTTTSFDPYSPMRISQIDFNVERTSSYLVAIHAKGLPNGLSKTWRSLVAQILVDGSTLTTSNPLESWKIYAGSSTNVPPGGWNSDPNFDDSGWGGMSDMVGCAIDDWYYMPTFSWYLNALYGGCAQRFWHHSGCSDTGTHTDLFIRIRMNLISPGELSTPTCPISWDYTATATTTTMTTNASATGTTVNDDPDVPTIPLLSDVQIVAIALSAVIGSLMMAIAYLFVRRYRSMRTRKNMAKGSAMQLRIDASSVLGLELPMYMSSSAMNSPAQSVHKANHVQDMLKLHQRLTSLGAINVSLYNRHVGDSGSPTATSNGQSSLATSPLADRGVSTLPELVRAYQKKRSLIEDRHSSRQTSESQTRTKTQVTRTDQTLVDGTVQGLEIPGFLQLKEGIDYNIDGEFASGGGGSLYRGCMFSIGLPYLNVIVKRMTSTSLPAFRQEVALMWLFNNCDYTVKLMGFNEAQLAVVMPAYSLGSLKHFIQAGNYDCKVVHSLVLDIAKGLLAMHDCGVVHQDIKPDNVLLDAHPTKRVHAVLADFGISNVVEDKALTVRAFEVKNARGLTIGFAPPEAILRFRNKDLSSVPPLVAKAGDVYSFAMVIFSLLENFRLPQSDPK